MADTCTDAGENGHCRNEDEETAEEPGVKLCAYLEIVLNGLDKELGRRSPRRRGAWEH